LRHGIGLSVAFVMLMIVSVMLSAAKHLMVMDFVTGLEFNGLATNSPKKSGWFDNTRRFANLRL